MALCDSLFRNGIPKIVTVTQIGTISAIERLLAANIVE